jgi:CBS domain-containing protein
MFAPPTMAPMNLVKHILEDARRRLAVLRRDAPVCDAAGILTDANTPLVVVCDEEGRAVGVLSRIDVVKVFARERADAANVTADAVMTWPFLSCGESQSLQSLWTTMGERNLRSMPVLDDAGRPLGVVHARDLARALIDEVTHEELLLRDYVLGIGYQ